MIDCSDSITSACSAAPFTAAAAATTAPEWTDSSWAGRQVTCACASVWARVLWCMSAPSNEGRLSILLLLSSTLLLLRLLLQLWGLLPWLLLLLLPPMLVLPLLLSLLQQLLCDMPLWLPFALQLLLRLLRLNYENGQHGSMCCPA